MTWLRRLWAWLRGTPPPRPYQPLLDCLIIVDDDPRLGL